MPSEDQSQELSKNTTSKIHEKGSCHQCAVFVDVKTWTRHQILLFLDTVEAQDRSVKGKSRHACSLPKWKKTNSCPSVRSEPPPQPEAQVVCSTACEDCGVRHALFLNSEVAPEDSTTRIATNWDRRLGECCRQTRTSCSVFRVRDTSCEAVRAKLCLTRRECFTVFDRKRLSRAHVFDFSFFVCAFVEIHTGFVERADRRQSTWNTAVADQFLNLAFVL